MNADFFQPWTITDAIRRDIARDANGRIIRPSRPSDTADWRPAVDFVEERDRFVLRADIPGVDPENIDVQTNDGILTVSGERPAAEHGERRGVQHVERVAGRFCRQFTLPETADADGITASSSYGTLEVVIPKLAQVQPRRITVEAA